jgi:hypothetical protein
MREFLRSVTTVLRIAFWFLLGFVLYFALTPSVATQLDGQDKLSHVFAFAALALTGDWPGRDTPGPWRWRCSHSAAPSN